MKKKEIIPKIRFKGFTNAWEQEPLRNIVDKYEESIPTPHNGYTRLGIRSHAKGTFSSYVEKGNELEANKMYKVIAKNLIVNITFACCHFIETSLALRNITIKRLYAVVVVVPAPLVKGILKRLF